MKSNRSESPIYIVLFAALFLIVVLLLAIIINIFGLVGAAKGIVLAAAIALCAACLAGLAALLCNYIIYGAIDPRVNLAGGTAWSKFLKKADALIRLTGWWSGKYAVICVSVDRFTLYNDYYGGEEGEILLKYIADSLSESCSARELSSCREANKFVLLMTYLNEDEIRGRVDDIFELADDGPNGGVSLSVGAYALKQGDREAAYAADMAEMARCAAANDENNNSVVFFSDDMHSRLVEEEEFKSLMRPALENDEFKLFLQPKHSVQTGNLDGAEALVRWISPEKGFISPGRFIPLFEKNGFVKDVDNYILEQLCVFQKGRIDRGERVVPVSVNVSRVQLRNAMLAEELNDIVDKYGVPHDLIEFEITESAFFDDTSALVSVVTKLRDMGFSVSMDDFGSGYSSLNLLKTLPFDTLKIDGEFFRHVSDPDRANIVVRSIISLAKELGMKIVAEGVETDEQVNFLRTTECDLIQGYYYSKPISAADFEKYMSKAEPGRK